MRAKTEATKRYGPVRLRLLREANDAEPRVDIRARPRTRGDCATVPRPCPYVSCRYHLYLDVRHTGNVQLNFPDLEPHELPPNGSCALDIADLGGVSLESIGDVMNFTRERSRQIEAMVLAKVRDAAVALGLTRDDRFEGRATSAGELLHREAVGGKRPVRHQRNADEEDERSPEVRAAAEAEEIDAWSNEVLAYVRPAFGLRLQDAWALANAEAEDVEARLAEMARTISGTEEA